jgi:GNAT superfamily N-acetyltransferase
MNNVTYEKFDFDSFPSEFFNACLNAQLYKSGGNGFVSHMKEMYEGKLLFERLTSIVAYIEDEPVGVIHCEYAPSFKNAIILKDRDDPRPHIEKRFGWGFHHLGFVNIFVKESYRNQSIATQLWNMLEDQKIEELKRSHANLNPLSVVIFQAQELSYKLIKEKSLYAYVTEHDAESYFDYIKEIDKLTRIIVLERSNEAVDYKKQPIKPNNKRK